MFRPFVLLTFLAVASVHGALLVLLPGESSEPVKVVQQQVIQGVLLAAPVSAAPKKVAPVVAKMPPQKIVVKKRVVKKLREAPPKKIPKAVPREIQQKIPEPVKEKEVVAEEPAPPPVPPPVEPAIDTATEASSVESRPSLAERDVEPPAVTPPKIGNAGHLKNPPPRYPRLSRRLGEEGEVILVLWVLADGTVSEVEVETSSGYPRLDKAALKAVKRWRYTPATRNGEAIAYRYRQPVQFSMK